MVTVSDSATYQGQSEKVLGSLSLLDQSIVVTRTYICYTMYLKKKKKKPIEPRVIMC